MQRRTIRTALGILTAAVVAAAGVTAGGAPAAADPVIVSSVDFEDGTTGGWTASGGGAGTLTVVDGPGGGKVLRVNDRSADYVGIQSPAGLFEPGAAYDFSMRVRLAEPAAAPVGVRFVMKPAYDWIGNTTMTADAWTTVTGSFAAPADADPAQLQAYVGTADLVPAAPYSYLVDDLLVTTDDGGPVDPGDVVPGGAINPVPTPVSLAEGTGDVAALTFDDGPNPGTTPALLDFLAANDLQAVFCVIGQNIEAPGGAEILRRIVDDGHVLCNHSTGYADMGAWTTEQVRADLVQNLGIIRTALGDPNRAVPFWRAPNGSWGVTRDVAVSLGMQPLAVVNTIADWETQDVATLTANLRAAMKPGEVVLAHDGGGDRSGTLAAVQAVVTERLAAGWSFAFPQGTPPRAGETVLSTGFEDGLDGWQLRGGSASTTAAVAVSPAYAHGGAQSAAVSNRESQGDGLGHDVTGLLDPAVTYEFSAWVRFGDGQPVDDVWLSRANTVDGSTSYTTIAQFDGVTDDGWTKVTATLQGSAADASQLYLETRYDGGAAGNTSDLYVDDVLVRVPEPPAVEDLTGIKETVDFPVGVAIDSRETAGAASELLLRHFDQVTPENFMKPEAWYDANGEFAAVNAESDALMDYAQANDLDVYGHVLVWHSQTPAWFFQDDQGAPLAADEAGRQVLRERLRTHIFDVAGYLAGEYGHFGSDTNPLTAIDVVNEVVSDGGEFADGLRRSEWFRILGEEFIDLSFAYAEEAFNGEYAAEGTDRPVTLFINDYNTEQGGKQDRYHALVTRLLERGVPVDGVGHQFHVSLAMPVSALETAIERFAELPVTQAVTELDVTTGTPVTQAKLVDQGYWFRDAFRMFREQADELFSVTVWGLTDGRSWRSDAGAPLVFTDALKAKPAYHGIVDGDLPARLRTANVFAGDVALDAEATGSIEWSRLPLHRIDEASAFQLRWAPDHLTVYVTVDDATADASDGVAFTVGDAEAEVARDGTASDGATAVVTERDGGYDLVAHLPLADASEGSTLDFDVRVADGAGTAGWNTPGELGTLTLVEPLSVLDVPEVGEGDAAPAIDGAVDEAWADATATAVTTGKLVSGADGATATVRTLWSGDTLYVLAEVADPVVDVSGSDPWIQDSVEIYVDPGNAKNGSYRYDDTQIRISAANAVSFGTGDEAFQRARVQSATTAVEGGYVVEASVDLLEYGGEGTFHGLDFQVNDASVGQRTAIRNWADPTGAGYQSTAHWGVGRLVGPVADPEPVLENLVAPRVLGDAVKGSTVTADPGEWSIEGAAFTYRWFVDGVPAKRGTEASYKVKPADVGRDLTVTVTATVEGAEPVSATSEPVTVEEKPRTPWERLIRVVEALLDWLRGLLP
ncbi:polysaccharide deacetylase family protein [Agromyces sp. CFH 90414]|uniref:Beta-xylanase n=1 Tax=Agromyces agglutinans TaxID=2662258 RepID=A0A6I2F8K3_9MICO|nr:endo-1,4-beta-xylanase [Agromyces agglutinans]MRG61172.1 polysaccharide deacetylase family protein [Agromyces agglutinans]